MARIAEKSALKRSRKSNPDNPSESKKPRRSERLSSIQHGDEFLPPVNPQLPSPVTNNTSASGMVKEGTAEPEPDSQLHQMNKDDRPRTPPMSSPPHIMNNGLSSPPMNDTQPFSQFVYPPNGHSYGVEDEDAEGVWGYLIPLDHAAGETLVLRNRAACPLPKTKAMASDGRQKVKRTEYREQEASFDETKKHGVVASGYLIGRHPECDRVLDVPTISNRHCIIFRETKGGHDIAVLEDLSGNGTFINESIVGRNRRRELRDGDEVAILDTARFLFHYPRNRNTHGFNQQYAMQTQLGKGHFASVYLCVERNSGLKYAVKKFEKRSGPGERSKIEGLQQEIAVLMGVSHPNLLCLKDVFDETDGVYLVLELAVEGELFNWIVMKSKLTEEESRKVFIQLFQGLKYLHDRNIVHRDIKPENILIVSKELAIKVADFGLAKIIGEESFTTTLCGTPSYVAPEILESSNHRRYTRAVDVWSAGVVLYICLCGFPPFSDELYTQENPYTLSQQIKLGRFDYPSPYWDPVSDLALDLIDKMLTVDVEKRITIDECLEHPWTTGQDASHLIPPYLPPTGSNTANSSMATTSTSSLNAALATLDFSMRKPQRERTLLSDLNDVKIKQTIDRGHDGLGDAGEKGEKLKVWAKNPNAGKNKVQRSVYGDHVKIDKATGMSDPEKSVKQNAERDMREKDTVAGASEAGVNGNGKAKKSTKSKGGKGEPRPDDNRQPEQFVQMGGLGDPPVFDNEDSKYP